MIRAVILALILVAGSARADVAVRMEQALRGWAAAQEVERAVMTVWRAGVPVRDVEIAMDIRVPVELASLSKAITGLCAAGLMRSRVWTGQTQSRDVLGYGPPGITVAALMTHSAGIGPDETQGRMGDWLDTGEDVSDTVARRALTREAQSGTPGRYLYNNENYAILGAMISAQMGVTHRTYCTNTVLVPAGVRTADPSPRTGAFAAWGGWQMPVADYARLMNWAYGKGGMIGRAPDRWPQAEIGGGAFYGVGMTQREFRGSTNFWHFGALCIPGRLALGSYAVSWLQDWSAVVAYEGCLDGAGMVALDAALAGAVFQ